MSIASHRSFFLPLLAIVALAATLNSPNTFAAEDDKANEITSIDAGWKYVLRRPDRSWTKADFDDGGWKDAFGGFGTLETPGARVSTVWSTPNIWLRKTVNLDSIPNNPALLIHHDEDVEVFINGQQVFSAAGYTTEYKVQPLSESAQQKLTVGKNLLAVHCRQTGGGQYIDVHIIDANNVPNLPAPKRPTTPFKTELTTIWGEAVTADNAWTEYPRPSLVREDWQNLNGNWDYAITKAEVESKPESWSGNVLVPFPIESKLSGVERLLDPEEALWYHRTFKANPVDGEKTLLNFEAVDYRCIVFVNDQHVGGHVGGNTPFSIDITDAIKSGENELVVRVEDDTEGTQLNGKQSLNPRGIWYTQVSGIWQTVWLEQVPAAFVAELDITTSVEDGSITVMPTIAGDASKVGSWSLASIDGNDTLEVKSSQPSQTLKFNNLKLWSPQSPHLYDLTITLYDSSGNVIEAVQSYAGIRSVGKKKDADGHWRFTLNGEVIFHFGPLDQGWWPDGLLTPPSDEAMLYDIEYLKEAGFNMIRKHIKVEPRRYYYHCDRLGMMVWQDQVSGHPNPPWTRMQPNPTDAKWKPVDHKQFMDEFEEMVDDLEFHPSIVVWTPFNEAWGQHQTVEVGKWILGRDPSRLVNIASGGNFWPVGDVADHHEYPHPNFPFDLQDWSNYVMVVGEFGGHGLPVKGHLYDENRNNWGYGGLPKDANEYLERYQESIRRLVDLKDKGIAAGVYTQTTDVEIEINGLMTYDRKVTKIPAEVLNKLHQPLYEK